MVFAFRLYVPVSTSLSVQAEQRLRHLCESRIPGRYTIEVVDPGSDRKLAVREQISAVPTVIREAPHPKRRVVGDLSDDARTAAALGLPEPWWRQDLGGR